MVGLILSLIAQSKGIQPQQDYTMVLLVTPKQLQQITQTIDSYTIGLKTSIIQECIGHLEIELFLEATPLQGQPNRLLQLPMFFI